MALTRARFVAGPPGLKRKVEAALRAWDPLETRPGVEGPPDEYDGYALPLVELALGGADVERVTRELAQLRRLLLAERDDPAADARIAALIVSALHEPAPADDEPRRPRKTRRAPRDEAASRSCHLTRPATSSWSHRCARRSTSCWACRAHPPRVRTPR
jgi:hypothetical protein